MSGSCTAGMTVQPENGQAEQGGGALSRLVSIFSLFFFTLKVVIVGLYVGVRMWIGVSNTTRYLDC